MGLLLTGTMTKNTVLGSDLTNAGKTLVAKSVVPTAVIVMESPTSAELCEDERTVISDSSLQCTFKYIQDLKDDSVNRM